MTQPLIKYQDVYRDAIQSLFGTNPSAAEIIAAYPHASLTGTSAIQTGGGTFFDLFARKGRDEWKEVETILSHFRAQGVRQSALIRGDFLVGYEPQPFDVIKAFVREYARMGMNVLQNFHGLNDTRALAGVVEAVRQVRAEEGHDIIAQGTICIEDNANITIDSCLRTADALQALGHTGFYLKSASGVLKPDFVYALSEQLLDNFDQEVGIHVHSTYGEAPVCYAAAIEAAMERGRPMTIDVQHPALAGSTAHPSIFKMQQIIKNHPNEAVRANAPVIDADAIRADMDSLLALRFRYRAYESTYDHDLLRAMEEARAPGGASSTLLGIPGLKENLAQLLKEDDWNKIQIAIYDMQKKILPALGDPTQVTPYAANSTGQAAISLFQALKGNDPFERLYDGMANYLVGLHGAVPASVDPALVERALKQLGLSEPVPFVLAADKEPMLEELKLQLKDAGLEDASDRQALSLAIAGKKEAAKRTAHIIACANGTNKPQAVPEVPAYATTAEEGGTFRGTNRIRSFGPEHIVAAVGGPAALQKLAERALHLKQIDDDLYAFPAGESDLKRKWRDDVLAKACHFLEGVPGKLKAAGFKSFQTDDPDFADIPIKGVFHLHTFDSILREACDAKGAGLYDHLMKAVKDFKRSPAYTRYAHCRMEGRIESTDALVADGPA